ncbi:MAG TPA: hypothetical protein VJ063_11315 [Verrucomicrobiae bacterium]|nr:hypothetical protein [Verrucomicrobiae bacterium]
MSLPKNVERKSPSTAGMPSMRWHWLYFALAGFQLLTIVLSVLFNHKLMNTYQDSVHVNDEWSDRLVLYSGLGPLASAVNRPR